MEYSLALTVCCKSISGVSSSAGAGVAVLLLPPTCSRYTIHLLVRSLFRAVCIVQ